MLSSLPIQRPKLEVNELELLSFQETVLLKDFCPNKIKKRTPELSSVIDSLIQLLPEKKIITVDVMKHNFISKGKTCVDPSFHVDGINNQYIIWSIGSFRTEFLVTPIEISGLGRLNPREVLPEIKERTSKGDETLRIIEAGNSIPILYDSSCIHRGRIAEAGHKRIMIRICSSDYIHPKNIDLSKTRR